MHCDLSLKKKKYMNLCLVDHIVYKSISSKMAGKRHRLMCTRLDLDDTNTVPIWLRFFPLILILGL